MTKYEKILKLWRGLPIKTEADLDTYMDSFKVLFAYNSNKIENANTTYEDTYEIFDKGKVSSYTGDVRTLTEIQNQKTAYQGMVKAAIAKEPITEELVLEFHRIITEGTYDERCIERGEKPGEYKHHHYVVGINETGAAPETVSAEINELLKDIATTAVSAKDVLIAGTFFHAKLEDIHPFADGNGRTGRILFNYFLITHNHPPVTIYDEDRSSYYKALEAFHSKQDLKPLSEFLEQQTVKTWEKALAREKGHER